MRVLVTFFREGTPVPQNNLKVGRAGQLYHGNAKLPIWRAGVSYAAEQALPEGYEPYPGPVKLTAAYLYRRPKTGVSAKAEHKLTVPDIGNLDKAIEDALSGIVYLDDKQIVHHESLKRWADLEQGEVEGALVRVAACG